MTATCKTCRWSKPWSTDDEKSVLACDFLKCWHEKGSVRIMRADKLPPRPDRAWDFIHDTHVFSDFCCIHHAPKETSE